MHAIPSPRRLVAALALIALPALSQATAHVEVQAGRSYLDSHGTNTAFVEAVFAPHAIGNSRYTWSPDLSAGWIDGRDLTRQYHQTTRPSVALVAAGARLRTGDEIAWYHPLFFSFQLAGTNHTTQALSSHYQFVSTLGLQFKHVSVGIRHISNGGLHDPNSGETMALVGVGFNL